MQFDKNATWATNYFKIDATVLQVIYTSDRIVQLALILVMTALKLIPQIYCTQRKSINLHTRVRKLAYTTKSPKINNLGLVSINYKY